MSANLLTATLMLIGLLAAGGLGWLQWRILKRVVARPNDWVAAGVVGAALSTPLATGLVLDALTRAGLPTHAALPLGLALLAAQLALAALVLSAVAWFLRKQ